MAIRTNGRRSAGYCHSNCGDHAKRARCEEHDLERFERQIARHMRLTLLGESNVPSVQFESLTIGKCRVLVEAAALLHKRNSEIPSAADLTTYEGDAVD